MAPKAGSKKTPAQAKGKSANNSNNNKSSHHDRTISASARKDLEPVKANSTKERATVAAPPPTTAPHLDLPTATSNSPSTPPMLPPSRYKLPGGTANMSQLAQEMDYFRPLLRNLKPYAAAPGGSNGVSFGYMNAAYPDEQRGILADDLLHSDEAYDAVTKGGMDELEAAAAERVRREFLFSFGKLSQYARTLRHSAAGENIAGSRQANGNGNGTTTTAATEDDFNDGWAGGRAGMPNAKVLEELLRDEGALRRFFQEQQLLRQLEMPKRGSTNTAATTTPPPPPTANNSISADGAASDSPNLDDDTVATMTAVQEMIEHDLMRARKTYGCPPKNKWDAAKDGSGLLSVTNDFLDITVAAQLECLRLLTASKRERTTANGSAAGATPPLTTASAEEATSVGGALSDSAAMAELFPLLDRRVAALAGGGKEGAEAASAAGGAGDAVPPDADGDAGASLALRSPLPSLGDDSNSSVGKMLRALLHGCDSDEEDLILLCTNVKDLRHRSSRLAGLTEETVAEMSQFTTKLDIPGSLFMSVVPPFMEDSHAAVLAQSLGEATAVAASMLVCYVEQRECNRCGESPRSIERMQVEMQLLIGRLMRRLHQELHYLVPERLDQVIQCLGMALATPDEVFDAISGVGALLFFQTLPLPLLLKVCKELCISSSDESSIDSCMLPETLAEKISAFLYPLPSSQKLLYAKLPFVPRLQVHEHAPGSFVCSVDNASNLGRMPMERLLSNRFSCSKIRWRAVMTSYCGNLRLHIWHRYTSPLSVLLLARTAELKKKKGDRPVGEEEAANGSGGQPQPSLHLEKECLASPGELVGFDEFMHLEVALRSPVHNTQGLRTYNRTEDRLVFQLSLGLTLPDGISLSAPLTHRSNNASFDPAASGRSSQPPPPSEEEDVSQSQTISVADCLASEASAREQVVESWAKWVRGAQADEAREGQKARQRTQDRERKALLARAGPTPELIKEVEKLTQSVTTARQTVAKLTKDRAKEVKEGEQLRAKVDARQAELTRLLESIKTSSTSLAAVEEDTKALQARLAEKRKRLQRREERRQRSGLDLKRSLEPPTTHYDSLAIDDFGSFLSGVASSPFHFSTSPALMSSCPPRGGMELVHDSLGMAAQPPMHSRGNSLAAAPSPRPSEPAGIIGGAGGLHYMPSHQGLYDAATSSVTPVFSTQPQSFQTDSGVVGGGLEIARPSPGVMRLGSERLATPASSTSIPGSGSMAFNSLAPSPFSTNPVTHHAALFGQQPPHLDANATPFQPSPMGTANASGTNSPGVASFPVSPQAAFGFTVTAGATSMGASGQPSLFSTSPGGAGGAFSSSDGLFGSSGAAAPGAGRVGPGASTTSLFGTQDLNLGGADPGLTLGGFSTVPWLDTS